jgi:hypothetical protein
MRLTKPPGAFFRLAGQYGFAQRRLYRPTKSRRHGCRRLSLREKEKREEKWMNVYLKGCCWLSTKISVKQLPYAPRIPDFGRFVVNSL